MRSSSNVILRMWRLRVLGSRSSTVSMRSAEYAKSYRSRPQPDASLSMLSAFRTCPSTVGAPGGYHHSIRLVRSTLKAICRCLRVAVGRLSRGAISVVNQARLWSILRTALFLTRGWSSNVRVRSYCGSGQKTCKHAKLRHRPPKRPAQQSSSRSPPRRCMVSFPALLSAP